MEPEVGGRSELLVLTPPKGSGQHCVPQQGQQLACTRPELKLPLQLPSTTPWETNTQAF